MQSKEQQYELIRQPEAPIRIEVPDETNIVFGDILRFLKPGYRSEDVSRGVNILTASSMTRDTLYFDTDFLEQPTRTRLSSLLNAFPNDTAIIFPGYGAEAVKEAVFRDGIDNYDEFWIPASRNLVNGAVSDVSVSITEELANALKEERYSAMVIVDDVSVSKTTLTTVRNAIEAESPIPLQYGSLVWFAKGESMVPAFQNCQTVCTYGSTDGKIPPFNSLSTWLRGDKKSVDVLDQYVKKYAMKYPRGFLKQLYQIRSMTTFEGECLWKPYEN